MKITFLGTSHGLPQIGRCCSSVLLEVGEKAYLIDGGAPVGDILTQKGFDFSKIKAIFTSHAHSDHIYGMLQFISLCNWYYKTVDMDIFFTEEALSEAYKSLELATTKRLDEERLRRKIVSEGEIFNDGVIKVTAIPTKHMEPYPSFAFVFEAEGKRFIYTGDLHGKDAADFPETAEKEPSDLIITESAHFKVEVIFEKLLACPTKAMAITHIYSPNPKSVFDAIKEVAKTSKIPLFAPDDGFEIEI